MRQWRTGDLFKAGGTMIGRVVRTMAIQGAEVYRARSPEKFERLCENLARRRRQTAWLERIFIEATRTVHGRYSREGGENAAAHPVRGDCT